MIRAFESVQLPEHAALSAYPNASLPDYVDGRLVYEADPEYFGSSALELREQGASVIGGCCGTTPLHIKAMKDAVGHLTPIVEKKMKQAQVEIIEVRRTGR